MANLQLIKDIAERKNITLESIATKVGISVQQLHMIVRKNSTKIDTLEKIANALNVSPCVFFDNRPGGVSIGDMLNFIEQNKGQVVYKEAPEDTETIAHLRKIIALYETIHPDLKEIN